MLPKRVAELERKLAEDVEPAYTITESRQVMGLSDSGMRKLVRESNIKTVIRRGVLYIPYTELLKLQRGVPKGGAV